MRSALLVLCVMLAACTPRRCMRTDIRISAHPSAPRPAGRVSVTCDGEPVAEILADRVE